MYNDSFYVTATADLNVLMFGIDSMSSMTFQRKLPDSLNFLKKDLKAVIFEGYNIVGDATTQALLPMFLGQLQHEIPDILERHLDGLDFVWKRYRERGYVTLFAEDEPHLGVFNLRLQGFEELPTDHYMRYFWQSQAQSHLKSDCSAKYCTGPTPNHHYLLQYITDFFHKYPRIPHFAVGFSGELSHDEVNPSQYLDPDLLTFLTHFKAEGYLNNTLLILFGDHGSRKGILRRTLQGKIEERLPFMSMVFPESFRKKHRALYENLKRNAKGLTTPFDIHKTLLDVLDLPKVYQASQQKPDRGVSLFRSIPENRTCHQAGVDTHWCTCVQEVPIPTSDPVATAAAQAVVDTINNLTQANRQQCVLLQLASIHSASLVLPNLQVLTFHKTEGGNFSALFGNATVDMAEFQITLETDKCRGVFEATVQVLFHQDGSESGGENQGHAGLTYSAFEHSISRIDTYGSQSACICKSNPNIMKYCCCERYLHGEQMTNC
ncbi:unnamed protein product [Candidula unifasciata]|uniref:Uncharacterized protein n=1 Tax=Candidula unifasciata TaxID=100452 RepID=A0A8S3ZKD9_9EUPU|nr:unnamed protein product [Candidula unifasciata]